MKSPKTKSLRRLDWSMSQTVIDWMKANLNHDAKIVELGGGDGSHRLHEIFTDCITVEHDVKWVRKLRGEGIRTLYVPMELNYYRDTEELLHHIVTADAIVVDGPPASSRLGFQRYLRRVQDGCILLIDDTHREYMRRLLKHTTIEVLRDEHRTTHIQRAKNHENSKTSPMVIQEQNSSRDSEAIPHSNVAEVQADIPKKKPTVRKVRKSGKRSRPHTASDGKT